MRIFILFISLLWAGCQPITSNISSNEAYFDLPGFAQALLETQVQGQGQVVKTIQVNQIQDISIIDNPDSIFWATELFPLLNGNINKPSLINAYSVQQDMPDESSNLLKTVYTALPESNTTIKKLEIKYLDSPKEIRQVIVFIDNKNSVYNTQQVIQLWTNKYGSKLLIDSLVTEGFNKTILLDSMKYSSKVVINR